MMTQIKYTLDYLTMANIVGMVFFNTHTPHSLVVL
jgi:hypothetical protein